MNLRAHCMFVVWAKREKSGYPMDRHTLANPPMPKARAAALLRSITRCVQEAGPISFTSTTTLWPVRMSVTRTRRPSIERDGIAAVMLLPSKYAPVAVRQGRCFWQDSVP
jgi:hypothetical protein